MTAPSAITAAPCGKCPFRRDVPIYLRRARRIEIARSLLEGSEFPCHATVHWSDGGGDEFDPDDEAGLYEADMSGASFCAGAAKSLMAAGLDNQMLRIIDRLGLADLDAVEARGPAVWDITTWQTLPEGATAEDRLDDDDDDDDEILTCNTVNDGCLAPAGYAVGGGIVHGTVAADGECPTCGEPVCSNCADVEGRCGTCSEEAS